MQHYLTSFLTQTVVSAICFCGINSLWLFIADFSITEKQVATVVAKAVQVLSAIVAKAVQVLSAIVAKAVQVLSAIVAKAVQVLSAIVATAVQVLSARESTSTFY